MKPLGNCRQLQMTWKRQNKKHKAEAHCYSKMELEMMLGQNQMDKKDAPAESPEKLKWLKASYRFHTYSYRDPRAAFATAVGLPVVSPTTVLLGVASTLFRVGLADEAKSFLEVAHKCEVVVDAPDGVIFFRAFHQLRRYETDAMKVRKEKFKPNPRIGLTKINQGTREYGLVEGAMTVFIGIPNDQVEYVKISLTNFTHLGTHDSLCSIDGDVESCSEPSQIIYMPSKDLAKEIHQNGLDILDKGVTIVTLSNFKDAIQPVVGRHWWMSGGDDTELLSYTIPGKFNGTTRGKIYRKN